MAQYNRFTDAYEYYYKGCPLSLSSLKSQVLPRVSLNFVANIAAALWMLVGSVRAFSWVKPTLGQFILFSILALGANILFAYQRAVDGSQFNEQGLISYLIWPVIMLIAGVILSKRTQNYALLFMPVILWLAADALLVLLQSGIQFVDAQGWLPIWMYGVMPMLFALLFVWQTAALLLIFAKQLHWPWWEQAIMLFGAVALLWVWQKNIVEQPIFKAMDSAPVILESDFYHQPVLLSEALANLDKSTTGVSDWYFVGVAGDANLDVFAQEAQEARELFDIRFGTKGRSIALINHPNTWQSDAIATKTSLERTLNHIGSIINPDEDVLFLMLTSHGTVTQDGTPIGDIAMYNPPLQLEDIDPAWLRTTLDNSGIRWRVIVVSACYSGVFLDQLTSPTTAIITASRADRASFGCTPDADLTYFGRAFFAEAMREQSSFDAAFNQSVRRIGEREALFGVPPSEPQMVVGTLMKTALPEFEKVLFSNHMPVTEQ